jgi:hypothetical protein
MSKQYKAREKRKRRIQWLDRKKKRVKNKEVVIKKKIVKKTESKTE